MKAIDLVERLRKLPLFTTNDLSRITGKGRDYVKLAAYRLGKKGLITRVERGKYTMRKDPVEIASYIAVPSYISFWTALKLHGLTEQLPAGVMVAVPRPRKPLGFCGEKIDFLKVKDFWGYGKVVYKDFDIFLADKEKAIIDSLMSSKVPFDEPAKAILSRELDSSKLVEYVSRVSNKSLAKRVGFLAEKAGMDASQLQDMVDSNYIPLDKSLGNSGKADFRWKVVVNKEVDSL